MGASSLRQMERPEAEPRPTPSPLAVSLLGGFEVLRDSHAVPIPMGGQRLLAYVALRGGALPRMHVAGTLWMDAPEARAAARLRSALWRLRQAGLPLVEATASHLRLFPGVRVDVHELSARAERILRVARDPTPGDLAALASRGELLPGWYEDWVVMERERLRQFRLRALETLATARLAAGRPGEALEAALAAAADEPLRESAHRLAIKAHLLEGNLAEAGRQYRLFRLLIRNEAELESPEMRQLGAGLGFFPG